MVTLLVVTGATPLTGSAATGEIGPKKFYLALGDSLAFGREGEYPETYGYTDQWFTDLQTHGVEFMENFSCMAESTTTMIDGGCPYALLKRSVHSGPQLTAAVTFIRRHPGQVSPVSVDIGVIDGLRSTWPRGSCDVIPSLYSWQIAKMDANLRTVILPALIGALTDSHGHRTGDLVLLNYYNPAQNICPEVEPYFLELNAHLAADAALFNVRIADIYSAFNSDPAPNAKICSYTWMCDRGDPHATGGQPGAPGNGYGVMAEVLEATMGY